MHAYVDQVADIQSVRVVVFTGGECFLFGDDLDDLVAHATKNGFSTRFVSNGYWAENELIAQKRIDKLVKAGLKEANFSTGDSHSRFVNPYFVRNGAVACAKAGLPTLIALELFSEESFDLEHFVSEPVFRSLLDEKKIVIQTSPWIKSGEKKVSFQKPNYSNKYLNVLRYTDRTCKSSLTAIAITPDEQLLACCGLVSTYIPEWSLGTLHSNTISEVLEHASNDYLKLWIHFEGPESVLRFVSHMDKSIKIEGNFAHICDACRYLYSSNEIKAVLKKIPVNFFKRFVDWWNLSLLVDVASQPTLDSTINNGENTWQHLRNNFTVDKVFNLKNIVHGTDF
jgi:organic radical activating enzyme